MRTLFDARHLSVVAAGSWFVLFAVACRRSGLSASGTELVDDAGDIRLRNALEVRLEDLDRNPLCTGRVRATRWGVEEELALDPAECVFVGARGKLGEFTITASSPGFQTVRIGGVVSHLNGDPVSRRRAGGLPGIYGKSLDAAVDDGPHAILKTVLIGLPPQTDRDESAGSIPLETFWLPDGGTEYFPALGETVSAVALMRLLSGSSNWGRTAARI